MLSNPQNKFKSIHSLVPDAKKEKFGYERPAAALAAGKFFSSA
jgi:hypothetical protein